MLKKQYYTPKLGSKVAVSARPSRSGKYHVVSRVDNKWAVVADGKTRASKVFYEKIDAIRFAKKKASQIQEGSVIVHNNIGEVDKKVSIP